MGRRHGRSLPLFGINLICLFLISVIPPSRAVAGRHYWAALGIAPIEEKPMAPSFTLKDLNGEEVKLEDHRGKIVFLNCWATWCLPCRGEMPSMEKPYSEFKDKDFTIGG